MAEEPEDLISEEPGDPAPPPSRARRRGGRSSSGDRPARPRRDRKPKEAVAEGAEGAAEALAEPDRKSRRTTTDARRGGEVVWGLLGTGVQVGGQIGGAPGIVAGGWVMQAQAKDGGRMLAQRLLDSRWYPYLEKLGRGGAGNMVIVAPVAVALYVQIPPMRPLLDPVVAGMLGKLTIEAPSPEGALVQVPLWQAIKQETAAQDARDEMARAEAAAMAAATSNGEPAYQPPPPPVDEPEPGVAHVRSRYNDLAGEPFAPPEI